MTVTLTEKDLRHVARGLVRHWPEWEAEAGQAGLIEQDAVAETKVMLDLIVNYLEETLYPLS